MQLFRKTTLIILSAVFCLSMGFSMVSALDTHGNYLTLKVAVNGRGGLPENTVFTVINRDTDTPVGLLEVRSDGIGYCNNQPFIDGLKPGRYIITLNDPNDLYEYDKLSREVTLEDKTVLPETIEVGMIGHVFGVDSSGNWVGNDDGDTSTIIWDTTFGTTQFYCGNSDAKSPSAVGGIANIGKQNTVTTEEMTVYEGDDREAIRKVMYYGWNGPAQWKGFTSGRYQLPYCSSEAIDITREQIRVSGTREVRGLGRFITHVAINHYHNDGRDWWGNSSPTAAERQDGYSDFIDFLDTQPSPPDEFVVYSWENYEEHWQPGNKRSTQDMFFSRSFLSSEYDSASVVFTVTRRTCRFNIVKYRGEMLKSRNEGISVEGTVYQLYTDSKCQSKAQDIYGNNALLTIGEDGLSNTVELYLGNTYYFKEISCPDGLLLDDNVYQVKMEQEENTVYVSDKIQKVRIVIQKKDSETGLNEPQGQGSFEGAIFGIYCDSIDGLIKMGEIVTDESGRGESEELYPDTYTIIEEKAPEGYLPITEPIKVEAKVNGNSPEVIDYEVIIAEDPVKVNVIKVDGNGNTVTGAVLHIEDEEGNIIGKSWVSEETPYCISGLLMGVTYYLVEDEAPDGYFDSAVSVEFTVPEDGKTITVSLVNEKKPSIKTKALYSSGTKIHISADDVSLTDLVTLNNLTVNSEYLIKGRVADSETGNILSEKEISFIARKETEEIPLEFEGVEIKGNTYIADDLYRINAEGKFELVCSHDDPDDDNQKLYVPVIGTTAVDAGDGDKYLLNDGIQTIKDTIVYKNLLIGEKYVIVTTLHYAETGEAVTDEEGNPYVFNTSFTNEKADGSVEVLMSIDGGYLKGNRIVIYEEILLNGEKIAEHCDPGDEDQTVSIPDLETEAASSVLNEENYLLTDNIQIIGFSGEQLNIKAMLMDVESGEPLETEEGVVLEKTVTVSALQHNIEIGFEVPAQLIENREVIFFEEGRLTDSAEVTVVHKDWNNEKQKVFVEKAPEPDIPETGDETRLMVYVGLLGLSLCSSSALMTYHASRNRKKRKK